MNSVPLEKCVGGLWDKLRKQDVAWRGKGGVKVTAVGALIWISSAVNGAIIHGK